MKKVIALAALVLITNMPISCCTDSCCGETFEPQVSAITDLAATVGTYRNGTFFNEESNDAVTTAIKIDIKDVELSTKVAAVPQAPHLFFISKALACDPPVPEPTQRIEAITITAPEPVYTMNKTFEPGSDLQELFVLADRNHGSITQFIREQNDDLRKFGWEGDRMVLQLTDVPDSSFSQPLHIIFAFDDASIFEPGPVIFTVDGSQ